MDAILSLLKADDVKTFPTIHMPAPVKKVPEILQAHSMKFSLGKTSSSIIFKVSERSDELPPLSNRESSNMPSELSGMKTKLIDTETLNRLTDETKVMTGFNAANILLDTNANDHIPVKRHKNLSKSIGSHSSHQSKRKSLSSIRLEQPAEEQLSSSNGNSETQPHPQSRNRSNNSNQLYQNRLKSGKYQPINATLLSPKSGLSSTIVSPKISRSNNNTSNMMLEGTPTLSNLHDRANMIKSLKSSKNDKVMNELRNYLLIMNQYSLHNFIIYNGQTLRDTPEFEALKDAFGYSWGSMLYIIEQLEEFVSKYNIKMAVIDGLQVYKLCQLNLSHYDRNELLSCIANSEQMKPQLAAALTDAGINQLDTSVIKIQSLIRRFIAKKRYLHMRIRWHSIITIQEHYRRRRYRMVMMKMAKTNRVMLDDKFCGNRERLRLWWKATPDYVGIPTNTSSAVSSEHNIIGEQLLSSHSSLTKDEVSTMYPMTASRKRLIIVIPSISSPEFIRLSLDHHQVSQNMHISCLYQLVDPDVHLIYVSPVKLTLADISYHEKMLQVLGIPTIPKRLHFIVPELVDRLPSHISLAQTLLCSSDALNKIKFYLNRIPNAMIIPTHISWAEKRLSDYLNIPMISPEPMMGVTIQSRSFLKKHLMEASVNIPLGAHDIFSEDDLIVAISRLISTNLDVKRWILKLNYDYNNESVAYLDVDKLSVMSGLRKEQNKVLNESKNNLLSWYSRPVQFSVRQRIISALRNELHRKIVICNMNIYPNWEKYLVQIQTHGLVIEEEPIEKLGYVDGLCFIDPDGMITYHGGCDMIADEKYQIQSMAMPATLAPPRALEGATLAIAKSLYGKFQLIGHVSIQFMASWNGFKAMPRLSAIGIRTGFTPSFAMIGHAAVIDNKYTALPKSTIPDYPAGLHMLTIPYCYHRPMKGVREEVFFKQCRMHGISFDRHNNTGTYFHLIDSIIGGAVSIMTVSSSRKKTIQLTIFALTFIVQQFGRVQPDEAASWEQATSILANLKSLLKAESDKQTIT